jgi:hypothetical protein
MVVRTDRPVPGADPVDLEDIAMAYLTRAASATLMTGAHR